MSRQETGKTGENIACGYLVNNGYKIIDRNYREKFGEIDIVAKGPDKTLVFIEVKTMSCSDDGVHKSPASYPHLAGLIYNQTDDSLLPEDQMSFSKLQKFKKICLWYSNKNSDLVGPRGFRLDAITIMLDKKNKSARVRHYENISGLCDA